MIKANWNYPTSVRFGAGRIAELPDALRAAGIDKPLLVTDAGLVNLPVTQNTIRLLEDAGFAVGVFADVKPNPISANVDAGVEVLRAGGHDGVIAFGGGSGLDVGKVIAFMAGQTRPMWD
ncbi:MAG TPA: iron-containing alcohol dehydrogenase, partial [Devosia sp.]|nr:iron-containing alcohol dehydrogenase [Devosia sp.]